MIWPLYVAGQSDGVSDEMREWVAGQLERIGDNMGPSKSRSLGLYVRIKEKAPVKGWREIGMLDAGEELCGDGVEE